MVVAFCLAGWRLGLVRSAMSITEGPCQPGKAKVEDDQVSNVGTTVTRIF